MKKLLSVLLVYLVLLVSSCICPNQGGSLTSITIHSARGLLYSFDENGVFPYFDEINREELGISILPDSTTQTVKFAQDGKGGNGLYACENQHEVEYINDIDSINVYTLYKFDDNHPAYSSVNDILRPIDAMGEILNISDISSLSFTELHLKFIQSPTSDSLQFEITGRIKGEENFVISTMKLILE